MPQPDDASGLNDALLPLLQGVSRSFYLSIRILPRQIRPAFALAYLLARAADTLSDAPEIALVERQKHLETFRRFLQSGNGDREALFRGIAESLAHHEPQDERVLIERLPPLFDLYERLPPRTKAITEKVLMTLTQGMNEDLTYFSDAATNPKSLKTPFDTERYAYLVAGCVGEFWTDLLIAEGLLNWQRQTMSTTAIRFGQGLQMINILRDLPRDLDIGRCYLSTADLLNYGIDINEMLALRRNQLDENAARLLSSKIAKLFREKIRLGKSWLAEGLKYVFSIPRGALRLRLAVLWPLMIGLDTLTLLDNTPPAVQFHKPVRITRLQVYRILLLTFCLAGSNRLLTWYYHRKGGIDR